MKSEYNRQAADSEYITKYFTADSVYDSWCMRFETELLSVFPQTPRLNLYVFSQAEFFIIKGQ